MKSSNKIKSIIIRKRIGLVYFRVKSEKPITLEQAQAIQRKAGYEPMGYGFFAFEQNPLEDNLIVSDWQCSTSCE